MMRLALFASGGGSNAVAILDAIDAGTVRAEAVVLVSDRPDAAALTRAADRGLPTAVVPPGDDEAAFAQELLDVLAAHEADAVALAGYLRKIPDPVVWAYRNRILNVHPSLLPAFGGPGWYGPRVHQGVIDYGCRFSGATVHLIDNQYDTGPVVLQETVEVRPGDTAETLGERVLAVEHRLFPKALALLAAGRIHVDGRRVSLDGAPRDARPDPAIARPTSSRRALHPTVRRPDPTDTDDPTPGP